MATNSTNIPSMANSPEGKAKLRLEIALTRLEKALEEKVALPAESQNLSVKLDSANREIAELKSKNLSVAERLHSTINKMKTILGDQ